MGKLTQERLKELLDYNPDTGVFTWKVIRWGGIAAGKQAGCVIPNGYRQIRVDYKLYQASRLAWLFMEGYLPEYDTDHINRIRGDDRWINIRHVSRQCNIRNQGRSKKNTSGVTGVCWDKKCGKWMARIKINYKEKNLGRFSEFKDAVKTRWEAEVECGWPECNSHSDAYCYLNQGV